MDIYIFKIKKDNKNGQDDKKGVNKNITILNFFDQYYF